MLTILDRLGDQESLDKIIDLFYRKQLEDPVTRPFFSNAKLPRIQQMQRSLLTMLFCGQTTGVAFYLQESHAHLVRDHGLNHDHFSHTMTNLEAALRECGHTPALVAEIMMLAWNLEDAILGNRKIRSMQGTLVDALRLHEESLGGPDAVVKRDPHANEPDKADE
ncbi:group I truncated hemoglobin [Gimibacter soli]|uniref:Group 1 truncated hemoglobin n=1 Tax=Gimibacter soli TaxID=3024400 RepID=A0AAE9XQ12_9PROT|nr:group 1 truncated hemoglobin [Gimibacter soli]WCL52825.1 group 1 truncated hemoglobin [Gimibacter soli]